MRFEGRVIQPREGGKYWAVEIPDLAIHTQGRSRRDAFAMARDAIEVAVDQADFKVEVYPGKGNAFTVSANDMAPLIARYLQFLRGKHGLTIRDVAQRLGSASPTAYAQYESGKSCPSVEKLSEIIHAMDPERDLVFKVRKFA